MIPSTTREQIMHVLRPTKNDTWTSFSFTMFIMFLMRDGWTKEEASHEAELLKGINASPKLSGKALTKAYFHITRFGATKLLNRDGRRHVAMTFENACNHASVHFGA